MVHDGIKQFECDTDPLKVENVCEPKLETDESILLEYPFRSEVDLCPQIKVEQDAMVIHPVDIMPGADKPFQCQNCYRNYKLKKSLKIHIDTVHDG